MTDKNTKSTTTAKDVDTWSVLHQQMEQSAQRLRQTMTNTPGEQKSILKKRAEKLAQKEKIKAAGKCIEVVEFRLAEEQYAVECLYVREVYPLKQLTPIPGTPDFILGIVSVRGEIISVVDLKKFFEMPQKGLTDLTRVIILHHEDMEFGILAEEVMGTVSLPVRDIRPPLPTLTGIRAKYLKGVAKNRLIVLDAVKLLTDKKMIVHQEVEI
jgi:purine-binding chemotaxis protein CheW